MKKWVIPLLLILSLTLTISVHALEPKISLVTPKLSFDGTTANCEVSINELGKEINATLELWCGSTLMDSWTNEIIRWEYYNQFWNPSDHRPIVVDFEL